MPYRTTDFDTPIKVLVFTSEKNRFSEKVRTWSDAFSTWAHQKSYKGSEAEKAGIKRNFKQKVFVVRAFPLVDATHRIEFEGRLYGIDDIEWEDGKTYQVIYCEELVEKPVL